MINEEIWSSDSSWYNFPSTYFEISEQVCVENMLHHDVEPRQVMKRRGKTYPSTAICSCLGTSFNIGVQRGCLSHSWQMYFQMRYSAEPTANRQCELVVQSLGYHCNGLQSIPLANGYWNAGPTCGGGPNMALRNLQGSRYSILDNHSWFLEVTFQVLLSRVIGGRTNSSSCAFQIAKMVFPIHTLDHHSPARQLCRLIIARRC